MADESLNDATTIWNVTITVCGQDNQNVACSTYSAKVPRGTDTVTDPQRSELDRIARRAMDEVMGVALFGFRVIRRGTPILRLEEEARRRAVTGVVEPMVSAGQVVTHERKYSDTFLCLLLKGKRPDTLE